MTDNETERRILAYKPRRARISAVYFDGPRRTGSRQTRGERCAICNRKEHGGGLAVFRLRDGNQVLVGGRCADFLDYLIAHPTRARAMLR
jgi:hypothetical protein